MNATKIIERGFSEMDLPSDYYFKTEAKKYGVNKDKIMREISNLVKNKEIEVALIDPEENRNGNFYRLKKK